MSDEPASEGEKPLGGQGRRRAPTIELAATELAAEQQASTTRDDERVGQPETASLSYAHAADVAQAQEAAQAERVSSNEQAAETPAQPTATSSTEAESAPHSTTQSAPLCPWP